MNNNITLKTTNVLKNSHRIIEGESKYKKELYFTRQCFFTEVNRYVNPPVLRARAYLSGYAIVKYFTVLMVLQETTVVFLLSSCCQICLAWVSPFVLLWLSSAFSECPFLFVVSVGRTLLVYGLSAHKCVSFEGSASCFLEV